MGEASDGRHRSITKMPPPGALSRARALLLELVPPTLAIPFDDWGSLAGICDTGWLSAFRRPSAASARVARRRLRALASVPLSFDVFAGLRVGEGPVHLRGTCAALPDRDPAGELWRIEQGDDPDDGRVLIEHASDFLLSVVGGAIYVLSNGGHLVSAAPVRPGDEVSVFGYADAIPDGIGLGASPSGRGGLLHAIRSGSELPLLVTHVVR